VTGGLAATSSILMKPSTMHHAIWLRPLHDPSIAVVMGARHGRI
jgi:hypothetical protein